MLSRHLYEALTALPHSNECLSLTLPKATSEYEIINLNCYLCSFRCSNNSYEMRNHLVMNHFKQKIKESMLLSYPYTCLSNQCGFQTSDGFALLRHYIGCQFGILEKFLKEALIEKDFGTYEKESRNLFNQKEQLSPALLTNNPIEKGFNPNQKELLSPALSTNDPKEKAKAAFKKAKELLKAKKALQATKNDNSD